MLKELAENLKTGYLRLMPENVIFNGGNVIIDLEGLNVHDAIQISLIANDFLKGKEHSINACDETDVIEISID